MLREVRVDLAAIAENFKQIQATVSPAGVMPIVKADAYGHGAIRVAEALVAAGAMQLGVADAAEATALREAGIAVPILCWLLDPAQALGPLIDQGIQIGISTLEQIDLIAEAAALVGPAKLHLKLDTGLGRNGLAAGDWTAGFERVAGLVESGLVSLSGTFSHLANASREENARQRAQFERALSEMRATGLDPGVRHLAASEAALTEPELRYDMVRVGIAIYGQQPAAGMDLGRLGLRPAMRVSATLVNLKPVEANQGVSYGLDYRTDKATKLALVSFGYADGLPRQATGFEVLLRGKRLPIVGRIAMDQFVLDVGELDCELGDEVVIFGDDQRSEPTASELSVRANTISYDIVTRMGQRPGRRYVEGP